MAIIPHLQVRNLDESIRFYRDVLGFHLEWQDSEDQDSGSAMMSRGDKSISFSAHSDSINTGFVAKFSGELMMFEEEVDCMFEEMECAANESEMNFSIVESLIESNGLRRFTILDCNGYRITFAVVLNDVIDKVNRVAQRHSNKRKFSVIQ